MDKRKYELFKEFGKAAPKTGQPYLAAAIAKTLSEKDIKAVMKTFATAIVHRDWAYGTVIEKRQGTVWSRAMYIGRGEDGSHVGTILGTSFGLGFGVDPGDQIHIAPEDWEKVDE